MGLLKRTNLAGGIVVEFAEPRRASSQAIIFCDGLPSMPSKTRLLLYWAKKGYWVFHPRYRGSWESTGQFLKQSPERDILDVAEAIRHRFRTVWSQEDFHPNIQDIFVIGASFGGTAALLASRDKQIQKVVALAPVVDWTLRSEAEPNEYLYRVLREGYAGAYRFDDEDWKRMARGEFFQPRAILDKFDPKKILIIQAVDDKVVAPQWVQQFAEQLGCRFSMLSKGGHASSSWTMRWRLSRQIRAFFNRNI